MGQRHHAAVVGSRRSRARLDVAVDAHELEPHLALVLLEPADLAHELVCAEVRRVENDWGGERGN